MAWCYGKFPKDREELLKGLVNAAERKKEDLAVLMLKMSWTREKHTEVIELICQLSDYWPNPPRRRITATEEAEE